MLSASIFGKNPRHRPAGMKMTVVALAALACVAAEPISRAQSAGRFNAEGPFARRGRWNRRDCRGSDFGV